MPPETGGSGRSQSAPAHGGAESHSEGASPSFAKEELRPAIAPPPGAVHLRDKAEPTADAAEGGHLKWSRAAPFVFLRGRVDVRPLKRKLAESGSGTWSAEEHARSNVPLVRPAHDNWGIGKAVFVFCDDYLKCVYYFPWWTDPEWRTGLQAVFDAIGLPAEKVCRCLLASMPPGCVIPPHHDTGAWVPLTHRLHVALKTDPDHVDFKVGATFEDMVGVRFEEGAIVELNNQAKHAVHNRWHRHRVHMIFDYVEDYPLTTRTLRIGDRLNQTRRTIGVEGDETIPRAPLPAFIIIGAQKCGTTSLYEYILQHPFAVRGRRRETHFFDWRWQPQLASAQERTDFYGRFFHGDKLNQHPALVTGESTPSYLLHFDIVIPRLREVAGSARLLAVLRDPVKRAYSHYRMVVDSSGNAEQLKNRGHAAWHGNSFEQVVDEEMAALAAAGVSVASAPEEVAASACLAGAPMGHGGHSLLLRGMYALLLRPWMEAFPGGQLKVLVLEQMTRSPEELAEAMDGVFAHVGLPPSRVADSGPKNTRDYEPLAEATRQRLEIFYAPHNYALAELLGTTVEALGWSRSEEGGGEGA